MEDNTNRGNIDSIIVGAGGTGGHLFPAFAVVEELKKSETDLKAFFFGNSEKLEARLVPQNGYSFNPIPIRGFQGLLSASTLAMPFKIFKSLSIVRQIIKREKPKFALCTGAYISFPVGLAAKQMNIPLVLMESNVGPGKAIKMLASRADLIISSFEATKKLFPPDVQDKVVCLGNPLRTMFENLPSQEDARTKFGLLPNKKTILIFGGSLGARPINNAAYSSFAQFANEDVQFLWQTGKEFFCEKEKLPKNVVITEFIDDMASAYAAADLVVSRSGATSVAEICYVGKPSILVPLSSAANNEQAANAEELQKQNAAVVITNCKVGEQLAGKMKELISDESRLREMSQRASTLARRDAAKDAVIAIRKLVSQQKA